MSILDLLNKEDEVRTNKIYGVVVGIVTDNKDKENLGRIQVRFPWRENTDERYWARLATLMAGKDRGSFFLPEVGDEVLVSFDRGEISQPYIIGSLWNGQDNPPEAHTDGKNNIRKIKSRSGHEIIFNDDAEAKKEKIEIHTKAGHKVVLDDASGQEKLEISDKTGSNKITIDSVQNSMNIESAMQLKIKSQAIEIESGGMMTIKAGATLTLQGSLIKIN